MLAPLGWLRKFVDIDMNIDDFVSKMIMSGVAVEGYEGAAPEIGGVIVGRILSVEKHQNADSLLVCKVDVGEKELQICTAATNVFEGALVPVAINGAKLAGGLKIKSTKMRGEVSEGMFCSYQELGLTRDMYPSASEHGILIFEEDYPLGSDVKAIFGIDDILIDFDILANRPDCQSILGVSREISAILDTPLKLKEPVFSEISGAASDYISVEVENGALCPRFCGRVVKNVKIGPSPLWMRNALNAVGIRPINNIVDITNYVMSEYGQPMHAYDMEDVRGGKIIVRNARHGEKMLSLDGKDRALDETMLVIADGEGATGIAGIMGGENSGIKPETRTVFFEAASFDFASVRVTAKKLGMRTAASSLFEKGVNARMVKRAMNRAMELVGELSAGEVVGGMIDIYPNPAVNEKIVSPIQKLHTLMGVPVCAEEMLSVLEKLEISSSLSGGNIISAAPEHRTDLKTPADIAEEILRMTGYGNIPSVLMSGTTIAGSLGNKHPFQYKLRELLCGAGFSEIMTFSFISPKAFDMLRLPENDSYRKAAKLLNPLGEDYSVMRTLLTPSMLQTLSLNYSRKIPECALFEIAPVFEPKQIPIEEPVDEPNMLSIGMYGADVDFYGIKGTIEMLLGQFGIKARYSKTVESFLHPGRSAVIAAGDDIIGFVGQVHPEVSDNYKIGETYIAQINIDYIKENAVYPSQAAAPPRFPAVARDVALIMDEGVPVGDCMDVIAKACGKLLDGISVFDVYRGRGVEAGKKSVAFSYLLRASDRTLTDDEINKVFAKVLYSCEKEFGAVLRS